MPTILAAAEYVGDGAPEKDPPTYVLVGKGVVHDSGGLCIKPGGSMPGIVLEVKGSIVWYSFTPWSGMQRTQIFSGVR